ncbi:DUF3618 domain-containing protein [Micromonospora echinofusca]|uniref:DUF3618 domain-containing protein n=1 Tax=Micromonospora echinofusca TaxID=47858 RepID=UPI0034477D78
MTPSVSSDPDRTRAGIEATRAELGATVQALAARTNVRARGRDRAREIRGRARVLRDRLGGTGAVARRHPLLAVVVATTVGLVVTMRQYERRP